jgi:hypothetical protein
MGSPSLRLALSPLRQKKSSAETAPLYYALALEDVKQEIVADVLAELTAMRETPRSWREELAALQASVAAHGGLNVGETTEEIVEHMRRTRREVWDAEYAHLYR